MYLNSHKGIREGGFTFIELVVAVALFSLIMLTVQRQLIERTHRLVVDRTVVGFNALIEGLYAFRIESGESGAAVWPSDMAELTDSGHLPIWTNTNGNGLGYSFVQDATTGGVIVSTNVLDLRHMRDASESFGSIARTSVVEDPDPAIDSTFTIEIGVGVPGTESSHIALLDRAGERSVQGTLEFDPGANLDLQGNSIENASTVTVSERITVSNTDGSAVIVSDNGDFTAITVDQLSIRP